MGKGWRPYVFRMEGGRKKDNLKVLDGSLLNAAKRVAAALHTDKGYYVRIDYSNGKPFIIRIRPEKGKTIIEKWYLSD